MSPELSPLLNFVLESVFTWLTIPGKLAIDLRNNLSETFNERTKNNYPNVLRWDSNQHRPIDIATGEVSDVYDDDGEYQLILKIDQLLAGHPLGDRGNIGESGWSLLCHFSAGIQQHQAAKLAVRNELAYLGLRFMDSAVSCTHKQIDDYTEYRVGVHRSDVLPPEMVDKALVVIGEYLISLVALASNLDGHDAVVEDHL